MTIKIRKATDKDLKEIDRIYVEGATDEIKLHYPKKEQRKLVFGFNKYKKDRQNGFNKSIKSNLTCFIITEENKKIVGFGEAEIKKNFKKRAEITMIYIENKFRRKGIGSKIMRELLKWLKNKKVEEVTAGILVNNKPSIDLNEKFGFKINSIKMLKKL